MKRKLIASILGLTAGVTMSYGQGSVVLNNYSMNYSAITSSYLGAPVKYGDLAGGTLGLPVAGGIKLELAYNFATPAANGDTATIPGSPNAVNGPLTAGLIEQGTTGIVGLGAGQIAGYGIYSPIVIPGYVAGTAISFEFLAFNGATYAGSTISGHSADISFASIATGATPATQLTGFSAAGFYINGAVPEPTTLALLGLGAAGLAFYRRRNKWGKPVGW